MSTMIKKKDKIYVCLPSLSHCAEFFVCAVPL